MLDEIEELELVLAHYAITWGVKLPSSASVLSNRLGWGYWGLYTSGTEEGEEGVSGNLMGMIDTFVRTRGGN